MLAIYRTLGGHTIVIHLADPAKAVLVKQDCSIETTSSSVETAIQRQQTSDVGTKEQVESQSLVSSEEGGVEDLTTVKEFESEKPDEGFHSSPNRELCQTSETGVGAPHSESIKSGVITSVEPLSAGKELPEHLSLDPAHQLEDFIQEKEVKMESSVSLLDQVEPVLPAEMGVSPTGSIPEELKPHRLVSRPDLMDSASNSAEAQLDSATSVSIKQETNQIQTDKTELCDIPADSSCSFVERGEVSDIVSDEMETRDNPIEMEVNDIVTPMDAVDTCLEPDYPVTLDRDPSLATLDVCMTVADDVSPKVEEEAEKSNSDLRLTETEDSLPADSGMMKSESGKPAIMKRRFSPGRPRVKQGRCNSFPGKKRPRGGGHVGRGRGRSRLKSVSGILESLGSAGVDTSPSKEDDDDDDTMHNTVVLFSTEDKFILLQDMCVVCGSFGRGVEGQLLACSQCGQCYHPYCVNSKITKVMLSKGWRCLECIVCEACGKASDPARLLLCDDCDISYHTYCLDPPLQTVPKGGWKCKWCVCCTQCGATTPGFHCEWQNNYTHCAPCGSLVTCPSCNEDYEEEDLLIQCHHCDRWVHAICENLFTEDEVEQAADEGFDCTACEPFVVRPIVRSESPVIAPIIKVKDPEPRFYNHDGVWLTESGMSQFRSLILSPPHKKGPKPKLKNKPPTPCSEPMMVSVDGSSIEIKKEEGEGEEEKVAMEPGECDVKFDAPVSQEREVCPVNDPVKTSEETEEGKKRKRKPYRPGIGGFMVRQRQSRTKNLSKTSGPQPGVSTECPNTEGTKEEGTQMDLSAEGAADTPVIGADVCEKAKKRQRRKKSKLEDSFPAYLQFAKRQAVAFSGLQSSQRLRLLICKAAGSSVYQFAKQQEVAFAGLQDGCREHVPVCKAADGGRGGLLVRKAMEGASLPSRKAMEGASCQVAKQQKRLFARLQSTKEEEIASHIAAKGQLPVWLQVLFNQSHAEIKRPCKNK
ncbi:hypothetical protein chiPu_0019323, partial [Chiloscyllium punctatum]|nr:hypothetical protein [Chiloscyllium punctatum]